MSRRPKILVVEDYAPVRDLIEATLTGSHVRTIAVCDGQQALVYLASERPDLVLTDFIMPNVDGLSLARQIRSRADLRDLPIVFLTGADSQELRAQCAELGMAAVIAKPFRTTDLVERLKQVLADAPDAPALEQPQGWVYAPVGAVTLPDSLSAANDRIILPVSPSELGRVPIIKSPAPLVEMHRPEPRIEIRSSPSSWGYLPLGVTIPEAAAVGRTEIILPHDPTPPRPIVRQQPRPESPAPQPRAEWVHRPLGAAELFDSAPRELAGSVDRAFLRLAAA